MDVKAMKYSRISSEKYVPSVAYCTEVFPTRVVFSYLALNISSCSFSMLMDFERSKSMQRAVTVVTGSNMAPLDHVLLRNKGMGSHCKESRVKCVQVQNN